MRWGYRQTAVLQGPDLTLWARTFKPWAFHWDGREQPGAWSCPGFLSLVGLALLVESPPQRQGGGETTQGGSSQRHPYPTQGVRWLLYIRGLVILLLSGKESRGDNCVSLGRNMGAGTSMFFSALGGDVYAASSSRVGWGRAECLTLPLKHLLQN